MDSLAQVRVIEEETHVYELQIGANLNAEAERRAAAQAAREAARAAQIAAEKALRKLEKDRALSLPFLLFGKRPILIETTEHDETARRKLSRCSILGVDFEWQPDLEKDANHRISLAQVSDGYSCYIWCVYKFSKPPAGLHALLTDDRITKVGCGMRGNDFRKLALSGMPVGNINSDQKRAITVLPNGYVDIQDFELRNGQGEQLPYAALELITSHLLNRRLPMVFNIRSVQWNYIQYSPKAQRYASLDAYAALLCCLAYRKEDDLVLKFLQRDDASNRNYLASELAKPKTNVGLFDRLLLNRQRDLANLRSKTQNVSPFDEEMLALINLGLSILALDELKERRNGEPRHRRNTQHPNNSGPPPAKENVKKYRPKQQDLQQDPQKSLQPPQPPQSPQSPQLQHQYQYQQQSTLLISRTSVVASSTVAELYRFSSSLSSSSSSSSAPNV